MNGQLKSRGGDTFGCDQEGMKTLLACMAATTLEHFRPAKNFVKRLAESFRNQLFPEMATIPVAIGNAPKRFSEIVMINPFRSWSTFSLH